MGWISKADAYQLIIETFCSAKLDKKTLDNWITLGKEMQVIKNKNKIGFDQDTLNNWIHRIQESIVYLDDDSYKKCFTFAVEAYYSSMTRADFNRGKQRDVGEFLTNQISGKLGEIAVQKQVNKLNIDIQLDFNVNGQIPSQDIIQVSTRKNVWNNPALKVSIKSTKLKNILLAIPENEIQIPDRTSDIYILAQVGLYPDHILRIIKQFEPKFLLNHINLIPDFGLIPARIAGWTSLKDLKSSGPMKPEQINELYNIKMAANNYVKTSGELSFNWEELCSLIIGNT
jgi:hypothetical protein